MVAGRSSEHGNPLRPRDRIHPGGAKMTPILRVLLSAAVLTGAAHAQSTLGTITGSITDPSGSAVPNAKVMGRNVGTNVERHVTADSEGLYRLTNLDPGEYLIEVEASGFRRGAGQAPRPRTAGRPPAALSA